MYLNNFLRSKLMTVQSDLKTAIAACESAKGNYDTFAQSTEDEAAKTMFQQMSQDMTTISSN
jgi:hypothetical protein